MNKADAKVGMAVNIIGSGDDQEYKVEEIQGFAVRLSYKMQNGNTASAGWSDTSLITPVKKMPTKVVG